MSRLARATGCAVLVLLWGGCDRDAEPAGLERIEVRQRDRARDPGASAASGAAGDVAEWLRSPTDPRRVVYHPPPDLRRPADSAEWPPVADRWPR